MPRHVEAWIDGVALSSVGPFLIQQVYEDAPALEITEGERPGRSGQLLITRKRQTLKVAMELVIAERFDLMLRTHYMEVLAGWAQGSTLELSSHPGRRLNVACTGEPALNEARNYASGIRIEWTAYEVPYWEDKTATELTLSGDDEEDDLMIPGTVPAPVSLTVTVSSASSAALTDFSVTVGGSTVVLDELEIAATGVITFGRDARDNLMIRSGTTGLLSKRTAESADDLIAGPGITTVSFTGDVACDVVFSVRGRWA